MKKLSAQVFHNVTSQLRREDKLYLRRKAFVLLRYNEAVNLTLNGCR